MLKTVVYVTKAWLILFNKKRMKYIVFNLTLYTIYSYVKGV